MKLLMISFHFPPISGSSGYLRALKFAKYLPKFNVKPIVLTANPKAYEKIELKNKQLLAQLPQEVEVHQAQAFNAAKTFSIRGKYLSWFAIPDKWSSWIPFALFKGLKLIKQRKCDAIWATYPISSAIVAGLLLSKFSKKKLYIDLRDPMWEEETWVNSFKQRVIRKIEKAAITNAELIFFTAPGTIEKYKKRYPILLHEKFLFLSNGYDEDDFFELPIKKTPPNKHFFLHSGLLPKYERDPSTFFEAVAELKKENKLDEERHCFVLRGTGHDKLYAETLKELAIQDIVKLKPAIDYRTSLSEMLTANTLLIFQHKTCNWQIPTKLYEYFRCHKPLLIISNEHSDTLAVAKSSGVLYSTCQIDHKESIKLAIKHALNTIEENENRKASYQQYSRESIAKKLAKFIN